MIELFNNINIMEKVLEYRNSVESKLNSRSIVESVIRVHQYC